MAVNNKKNVNCLEDSAPTLDCTLFIIFNMFCLYSKKTHFVSSSYIYILSLSLYFYICRKRIIRISSGEDDVNLVHREQTLGKESKSVQVGPKTLNLTSKIN